MAEDHGLPQIYPINFSNCRCWFRACIFTRADLIQLLIWGFPGGLDSKLSACNMRDLGSIPGSGRSPGEGDGNSVFLPGESHGQRSLAGYSPQDRKELDMTEGLTLSHFLICRMWLLTDRMHGILNAHLLGKGIGNGMQSQGVNKSIHSQLFPRSRSISHFLSQLRL